MDPMYDKIEMICHRECFRAWITLRNVSDNTQTANDMVECQ